MSKDEQIKELQGKLAKYERSPLKGAYLSVLQTMNKWFLQLKDSTINITNEDDKTKFEMVHKFFTELTFYIKTLDEIRAKMTAEEKTEVDKLEAAAHSVEDFLINGR